MKRPSDWNAFLTNDENKRQFIRIILKVWSDDSFARKLQGIKVILVSDGHAYLLTSLDGQTTIQREIETIRSNQEETDTRVILYCQYAKEEGYANVKVKSTDSDIFFITLQYVQRLDGTKVFYDSGKKLIDVTQLSADYTQEQCTALLAMHAFTKCDTTSAFKGIGKVKPIKVLQKMQRFRPLFASIGETWNTSEDLIKQLDEFTCAMYGKPKVSSVNDLRLQMLQQRCSDDGKLDASLNIDIARLPPCLQCLEKHIRRVNFQVAIWRRAHVAEYDVPDPTNGHGWILQNGLIQPLWTSGDVLPIQLEPVLERVVEHTPDTDDEDDEEEGYDDIISEIDDSDSD